MPGCGTTDNIFILNSIKAHEKELQYLLCICWPRKGLWQGVQKFPMVGFKENRHIRVDCVYGSDNATKCNKLCEDN